MRARLAILAGLFFAASLWANRILSITPNQEQVTLTHADSGRRWRLNDTVCLFAEGKELACGFVGRLTVTDMVVQLETRQVRLSAGQQVQIRREVRHPSSVTAFEATAGRQTKVDVNVGLLAGFNYFFPAAEVQLVWARSWSVGLQPFYASFDLSNGGVEAYGGFVNLSYFYSHFPFRGLFFRAGAGLYDITVTTTTDRAATRPIAVTLSAHWRGKPHWGLGVDIGIGAGMQYVFTDAHTRSLSGGTVRNDFSGLLPLLTFYLGYSL